MKTLYTEQFLGVAYHARDQYGNPIPEINTVNGWVPYWREGKSENIFRPEMSVIDAVPPYIDPPRTNGMRGLKVFKLYGRHDAGYWKQFSIPAGTTCLHVTAQGCHWYSQRDDQNRSEYKDAQGKWHTLHNGDPGATIMVGLDLTGGVDPLADSVVWDVRNVYDSFAPVEVTAEEPGAIVTVFLRSQQLYPFKHTDCYWASVELAVDGAPACWGVPRVQYEREYYVIPATATLERATEIFRIGWKAGKITAGGSSDDAAQGALDYRKVVEWDRPASEHAAFLDFYNTYYPGARVEFRGKTTPPIPPLPPDRQPRNYVPNGTELGFHRTSYTPSTSRSNWRRKA